MQEQQESMPWISVEEALQRIKDQDTGPRRHFVILGAGVAGLAAAIELLALRHGVTVLEGSERVGGRVHTRRFPNGAYGELGAMRIPGEHDYTHHYVRKAGLEHELRPFPSSHPHGKAVIRGVVCRWTNEDFRDKALPKFTQLHPQERSILIEMGPGGLLGVLMEPLFASLSEAQVRALLAGDFSEPRLRELDELSWHDYLRDHAGASDDAREVLGAWLGLRMPWQWSMAAILRDELNHTTDKLVEIAGGLDRLPVGMAAMLPPGVIRFRTVVDGIERRDEGGGVVHVRDLPTGAPSVVPFAQLLCTLPFPVLDRMPMGLRGFSPAKLEAIRGLGGDYSTATKVLFQYDERWWESEPERIAGGRSMTDAAAMQTYYPTPAMAPTARSDEAVRAFVATPGRKRRFAIYTGDSPQTTAERVALAATATATAAKADTPGVILASYSFNEIAKEFGEMSEPAAAEMVLSHLRQMHPEMPASRVAVVWCWDKSPWAGKAFALTRPGTLSRFFQESARAEGPIHFAGEHVSIAPAWIQGALESSLREVAAMVKWTPSKG
jgi:monoamine oxidase